MHGQNVRTFINEAFRFDGSESAKCKDAQSLVGIIAYPHGGCWLKCRRAQLQYLGICAFAYDCDVRLQIDQAAMLGVKCHVAIPKHQSHFSAGLPALQAFCMWRVKASFPRERFVSKVVLVFWE